MIESLKFDCRYFKGHIPCKPNKLYNKECSSCDMYEPISKRILIIKLGAIGDVIRTTPLIVKYRALYPGCHITWVTQSPDILPASQVDVIYKFDFTAVYTIQNTRFDIAINLDKEPEACSLLKDVTATEKYGFIWNNHHIDIATPAAEHKLITGLFDHISKTNTKHYLDEIFEICHLQFNDEPFLLDVNPEYAAKWDSLKQKEGGKPIIGLNTGCGKRWTTRLWPNEYWIQLIKELQKNGYFPMLLGGEAEDENNRYLSAETGAYYPGHFSLKEFIALTSKCDLVVTQVSMMMHIVTALKVPLVLMNNIFNKHEFYLYGNGAIVEPSTGCDCYYGNTCKRERSCMHDISVASIFGNITNLIKK
ncbi:MAG TPA: glycosyltransferase family 9 protein [Bacteroidales bacterium]|nr:glycosyltransferase family 9 protein [Bacteroidales bacterium]